MNSRPAGQHVYHAIADPTRRAMLVLLTQSDKSVQELAQPFEISQPAVSQHLKVLREAGLVTVTRKGRRMLYRVEPAPLKEVYNWLEHFGRFWEKKLDALGAYLDTMT
jgi:DNA-binding transcriptional ArsR family regulator